jgi:hypothetical protein
MHVTADGHGDAASTAAAATPNSDTECVEGCKARLATLLSHEAELGVELSELESAFKAAVERAKAKREAVRAEIKAAKIELDAAVNAPVSGGRDPTKSLPDELIVMIMLMLPFATLWSGACERVCVPSMEPADGERPDRATQARGAVGGVCWGCN